MYSKFLESKKVEPFWSLFLAVLGSGIKPSLSGPNSAIFGGDGGLRLNSTVFWLFNNFF